MLAFSFGAFFGRAGKVFEDFVVQHFVKVAVGVDDVVLDEGVELFRAAFSGAVFLVSLFGSALKRFADIASARVIQLEVCVNHVIFNRFFYDHFLRLFQRGQPIPIYVGHKLCGQRAFGAKKEQSGRFQSGFAFRLQQIRPPIVAGEVPSAQRDLLKIIVEEQKGALRVRAPRKLLQKRLAFFNGRPRIRQLPAEVGPSAIGLVKHDVMSVVLCFQWGTTVAVCLSAFRHDSTMIFLSNKTYPNFIQAPPMTPKPLCNPAVSRPQNRSSPRRQAAQYVVQKPLGVQSKKNSLENKL